MLYPSHSPVVMQKCCGRWFVMRCLFPVLHGLLGGCLWLSLPTLPVGAGQVLCLMPKNKWVSNPSPPQVAQKTSYSG